jgi:hypothetical protein
MSAFAPQLHGAGFHLTVRAAVLSELAALFDLAQTGRMGAFFRHRDLLVRLYAGRILAGKPSRPAIARRSARPLTMAPISQWVLS